MKKQIPSGEDLRRRAEELGVVITKDDPTEPSGDYKMFRAVVSEAELQQRVLAAENMLSARRAWIYAAISAAASFVSALAALAAVFMQR